MSLSLCNLLLTARTKHVVVHYKKDILDLLLAPDYEYGFGIIAALKSMFSSESLKSLRVLKIDGNLTGFRCDYIDQIAEVLGPVLQHLDINFCRFPPDPFKTVFNRFPILTELDASYTSISSLQGISQLKNLEKLSLAGLAIGDDECQELFKLRKLQFLNLANFDNDSGRGFVKYSFKVESALPELKVLDISKWECNLTTGQLTSLVEIYPKLETIGLINYQNPPIAIPGVKLLVNTTIEQCLESLDYYLNNWGFQHDTITKIIMTIHLESERTSEELMIQCLGKIIEAIDHGAKFMSIYDAPFEAFSSLINEYRLQKITPSQRHSLARYLLAQRPRNDWIRLYFRLFQQCFTNDAFLASPYINYSMVCNKTIDFVQRGVTKEGYRQAALDMGVEILSRCLCKMSTSDETFREKKFDRLFDYLMSGYNRNSRHAAVAVFVHAFSFSTNQSMTEDQKVQLMTEIMHCIHGYGRNCSNDIRDVHRFIQAHCESTGVKDWIDWLMIKMCGDT